MFWCARALPLPPRSVTDIMPRAGLLIAQFEALPEAAQKEALEHEDHKAKRRASAGDWDV